MSVSSVFSDANVFTQHSSWTIPSRTMAVVLAVVFVIGLVLAVIGLITAAYGILVGLVPGVIGIGLVLGSVIYLLARQCVDLNRIAKQKKQLALKNKRCAQLQMFLHQKRAAINMLLTKVNRLQDRQEQLRTAYVKQLTADRDMLQEMDRNGIREFLEKEKRLHEESNNLREDLERLKQKIKSPLTIAKKKTELVEQHIIIERSLKEHVKELQAFQESIEFYFVYSGAEKRIKLLAHINDEVGLCARGVRRIDPYFFPEDYRLDRELTQNIEKAKRQIFILNNQLTDISQELRQMSLEKKASFIMPSSQSVLTKPIIKSLDDEKIMLITKDNLLKSLQSMPLYHPEQTKNIFSITPSTIQHKKSLQRIVGDYLPSMMIFSEKLTMLRMAEHQIRKESRLEEDRRLIAESKMAKKSGRERIIVETSAMKLLWVKMGSLLKTEFRTFKMTRQGSFLKPAMRLLKELGSFSFLDFLHVSLSEPSNRELWKKLFIRMIAEPDRIEEKAGFVGRMMNALLLGKFLENNHSSADLSLCLDKLGISQNKLREKLIVGRLLDLIAEQVLSNEEMESFSNYFGLKDLPNDFNYNTTQWAQIPYGQTESGKQKVEAMLRELPAFSTTRGGALVMEKGPTLLENVTLSASLLLRLLQLLKEEPSHVNNIQVVGQLWITKKPIKVLSFLESYASALFLFAPAPLQSFKEFFHETGISIEEFKQGLLKNNLLRTLFKDYLDLDLTENR